MRIDVRAGAPSTVALVLAAAISGWMPATAPLSAQSVGDCEGERGARLASTHCIRMIPSQRAPEASGTVRLRLAPSPYGVTTTEDGHFLYDVELRAKGLASRSDVTYVAWATTPGLDRKKKLGALDADGATTGQVSWNKFIVLVTAETSPDAEAWSGPILLTAISPSGRLHTMAGEEIFGNNELPVGSRHCLIVKC